MMNKVLYVLVLGILVGCMDAPKKETSENKEKEIQKDSLSISDMASIEKQLKKEGYKTFSYKEGDTTYLMQQYYMVFLKSGPERSQDSTEAAELQKKHLAHLERMAVEGYTSLTGPMGGDGDLRGIVVYNTATQKEADSLANMDPMVKAGRLIVEVHPWWVAKGGVLK